MIERKALTDKITPGLIYGDVEIINTGADCR
jgi:hypothetical protein